MDMNKLFPILSVLLIILGITFAAHAQQALSSDLPSRRIEDDSSLRISLRDSWLNAAPSVVLNKRSELHTLRGGSKIQVSVEAGADEFAVVLARELPGQMTGAAAANSFRGWAQGSWVLTRRKSDGAPLRVRVFLRSDLYVYIQFRPFSADKCQMDVVLYDAYLVRSLPLPVSFERVIYMPVEEVLALAGDKFPRKYFDPYPDLYRDTWNLVSEVRSKLPGLKFADDGAIDENGNYVFIETLLRQNASTQGLNCSGFAKWFVDGMLKPHTGNLLPVTPLKQAFNDRGSSFTEPWDRIRDPFFGLDWIRNLASTAGGVLRSPAFASIEEFEVRSQPFSQVIVRQGNSSSLRTYPGFLKDAGFGIEGLHPLLYTLAIDEPGRIYLAAVNDELGAPVTPDNLRGLPKMRQYFHVAVLVPYFNEQGNFQVAVFESAAETSFTFFKNRYPGHYVNLVRIPVDGKFSP